MSIHSSHLKDDQLVERYLTVRDGQAPDPRVGDHLASCADCATAYDAVASVMDDVRETADEEIDELFQSERLLAQQQEILRRLEQVHRSARVISFPGHEPAGVSAMLASRLTPRWTAAAAAACLLVGLGLGAFIGPDPLHRHAATPVVNEPVAAPPVDAVPVTEDAVDTWSAPDDDEFLNQLELALARPHTRELQPFDELTPRASDSDGTGR